MTTSTIPAPTPARDTECDVLVVGSGAGGLAAAIAAAKDGLRVIVAEKSDYLGGTSAISGGWAWVPGSKPGLESGDTREDIESYIQAMAGDSYDPARVKTFLDAVPEALDFFERTAGLQIVYGAASPDYQMEAPGARTSGRAVTFAQTDARILGEDRLRLRPYYYPLTVFGYMPEIGPDLSTFLQANRSLAAFRYVQKKVVKNWAQTATHRRGLTRTNGNALMAQMLATARSLGVPMWTEAPATRLVQADDGTVTGAVIGGRRPATVAARVAVILAAGGFGANQALRRQAFPHDPQGTNHATVTQGHGGDSLTLAQGAGGLLDTSPHSRAAWAPVTVWRSLRGEERRFPHLRAFGLPGFIAVNRHGRRFANESLSYHDFGRAMIADSSGEDGTFAYLIGDRDAVARYGIGYLKPWPIPTWYYKKVGFLVQARTVEALAAKIDVPADALRATLAAFNADAERGVDSAFARGSTWFHHFRGDPDHKPNPNLAPLRRAPFYAVRIQMADLGTFAGLAVDERSQVVTASGRAVPHLYAVGTAAVSPFGGGYTGYGACIGPALVFGYATGRDVAASARAARVSERAAALP